MFRQRDADGGWFSRRCTIQSTEHRACRVWRSPMPMSIRTHSVGYGDTQNRRHGAVLKCDRSVSRDPVQQYTPSNKTESKKSKIQGTE